MGGSVLGSATTFVNPPAAAAAAAAAAATVSGQVAILDSDMGWKPDLYGMKVCKGSA